MDTFISIVEWAARIIVILIALLPLAIMVIVYQSENRKDRIREYDLKELEILKKLKGGS